MRRFFSVSKTARTMCLVLCCLFAALLAAGLLVCNFIYPFERPLPYTIGLVAGTLLSMLKVVLMEKSIGRSFDMEGGSAKNYAALQAILRYLLTIVVLLGVVFFPGVFGLFGVIIGILSLQAAAYVTGYLMRGKEETDA